MSDQGALGSLHSGRGCRSSREPNGEIDKSAESLHSEAL